MAGIAIYARKSTESEDRQILSIDSQIKELKQFAVRQGIAVKAVFTESQSAKAPGRPVFNDLYSRIEKGTFDGVVCWKLDRLARNPVDGGALIWAMDEGTIKAIHTPQRSYLNTGNDKFLMQLEFGMAKKYVDDLSDNTKRGLRAKLEMGWRPGVAPIGYLNDKETKTIIPDPERFQFIRRMWELMATGNYSCAQILKKATYEWGLRSRMKKTSGGGILASSEIYRIFTNPFYYGLFEFSGMIYKGAHKPMISPALYDKVQEILGLNSRERPQKYEFTYAGLMTCGECGASITAENKINRQGHRYTYYHCTKRKRNVRCSQAAIEVKELEHQIDEFLRSIAIPKSFLEWSLSALQNLEADEQQRIGVTKQSLERRLGAITKEKSELIGVRLRGLLTDEEFALKNKELANERVSLEASLANVDKVAADVTARCQRLFEFANSARTRFANGSAEDKRAILRFIGSNPTIYEKKLRILPQKPFQSIQNLALGSARNSARFEPAFLTEGTPKSRPVKAGFRAVLRAVEDVRTFYRSQLAKADVLK